MRNLRRVGSMMAAILASAVLASPATAGAAKPPQLYVASGENYFIAFEVEGTRVSVLGLDAEVHCAATEPYKPAKPEFDGFFPLPIPMTRGPSGLTAVEEEREPLGRAETSVVAELTDGKVVGEFTHTLDEEYFHCSTGPEGARGPTEFQAVRYGPTSSPEAGEPVEGESAVYLGESGPLRVFLRSERGHVFVRGSLASTCRFGGRSEGIYPLFSSPRDPAVDAAAGFDEEARYKGKLEGGRRFFEPVHLSGIVGADSIGGFYSRTRVIAKDARVRHRCGTHSLPFTAERYVPATG